MNASETYKATRRISSKKCETSEDRRKLFIACSKNWRGTKIEVRTPSTHHPRDEGSNTNHLTIRGINRIWRSPASGSVDPGNSETPKCTESSELPRPSESPRSLIPSISQGPPRPPVLSSDIGSLSALLRPPRLPRFSSIQESQRPLLIPASSLGPLRPPVISPNFFYFYGQFCQASLDKAHLRKVSTVATVQYHDARERPTFTQDQFDVSYCGRVYREFMITFSPSPQSYLRFPPAEIFIGTCVVVDDDGGAVNGSPKNLTPATGADGIHSDNERRALIGRINSSGVYPEKECPAGDSNCVRYKTSTKAQVVPRKSSTPENALNHCRWQPNRHQRTQTDLGMTIYRRYWKFPVKQKDRPVAKICSPTPVAYTRNATPWLI
ncbi:hypothetical protein WN55_06291 [Dufourea novaeangliae]|uniref:Uncharacterized protein n=1 Tax=Dufourea novaeangliae TaxID=178035 RepID=A0A154PS52_DUFNO|nr:hypothetical protein WN55_06291 [Dufourea novaeangliae]